MKGCWSSRKQGNRLGSKEADMEQDNSWDPRSQGKQLGPRREIGRWAPGDRREAGRQGDRMGAEWELGHRGQELIGTWSGVQGPHTHIQHNKHK